MSWSKYYILFLIIIFNINSLIGQISISYSFVKPNNSITQKKFSHFNSLKIINHAKASASVKTQIVLPKGWKLAPFMPLEEKLIIPANDSIFIPVKMIIPKYARGGKTYHYRMELFDIDGKFIGDTKASLTIPEISNWEVEVLENDLLLPFDSSQLVFQTKVSNKGNKTETISIHYRIQDKIASKRIDLEPGFDSTLTLTAEYSAYENYKAANREYIGITASNGLDVQDKTLYFVKFKNGYDGLRASRRPNSVGFFYDNIPNQNFSTLGFRVSGSLDFSNESTLSYYLTNTDILNNNQLINSSVYRLQYLSNQLDIGVGSTFDYGFSLHQVNTIIGRRPVINGNNALNITWRPIFTSTNQTTIFVTRNVLQPITTVFGGHRVRLGQSVIEGGFTYNLDFFGKRSLKIGSIRAKVPLGANHFVQVQANGAEEKHHLLSIGDHLIDTIFNGVDSILKDKSFNYRLFYSGRFFNVLNFRINNSYSSIYYPNGERGLFNFDAQLTYQLPKNKYFRFGYRWQNKSPYTYQNGLQLGVFGYSRENILAEYSMPVTSFLSIRAGALVQKTQRQKISNFTLSMATFSSSNYKTFLNMSSEFGKHRIQLTTLYGYTIVNDFMNDEGIHFMDIPRITSFDTRLDYNTKHFRFGVNYILGPNGTVGQYDPESEDLFSKNLRLFTAWQQRFFKRRLLVSISASGFYQFNMSRGNVSISPRIAYNTKKNWRFDVSTNLNFFALNQNNTWQTQFNPRFQIGVYKDFYVSLDVKHYNLDIICFKDDNGNGQMEAHEFGLPDANVTVIPHKLKKNNKISKSPINLFSDKKGKLFFKKLPEGQYEIEIDAIHNNLQGYTIKSHERQIVNLAKNTIVYIPFAKANIVRGTVKFNKTKFSKTKLDLSNIRVIATDKTGNEYYALTDKNGNYNITLPDGLTYTVTINNPFLKGIKLKQKHFNIHFDKQNDVTVNFTFYERKRKVNFD